jgi:hypothetical protein
MLLKRELLSGTPLLTCIPVVTGVLVGVWLIPIELVIDSSASCGSSSTLTVESLEE